MDFKKILKPMIKAIFNWSYNWMFNYIDKNKDGALSKEEIEEFVAKLKALKDSIKKK